MQRVLFLDLENDLDDFCGRLPHRRLQGRTRALTTFTPEMFEMLDEIQIAARHNVSSLLIGETGCGKTFLASLIHELSAQADERFCTVACGALPPDLIESELFGYVQGAFTGADRNRDGKFAAAGNGTLLLDEIDVLPPDQQAKLLRVIETGEYEPVGSNETQHFEGRLIVASNYDLEQLVQGGTFRTDLYYRLNILSFRLPPLGQRPWDIEFLARKFALDHGRKHGIKIRGIEPEFLSALRAYPWPGNIREMENVICRAVLYSRRGILAATDLPRSICSATGGQTLLSSVGRPVLGEHHGRSNQRSQAWSPRSTDAPTWIEGECVESPIGPPADGSSGGQEAGRGLDADVAAELGPQAPTLESRMERFECGIIQETLDRHHQRRKESAAELGISRVTLYNKMKKFGLL